MVVIEIQELMMAKNLQITAVLLNGSSLDDCGRQDDCLDKTSLLLVFILLKSRHSDTTSIAFRLYSLNLLTDLLQNRFLTNKQIFSPTIILAFSANSEG